MSAPWWEMLTEHASGGRFADAAVLGVEPDEALTFGELLAVLGDTGDRLRDLGVQPSDRVVVCMPPGPQALTAILSTTLAAVCVPVNPSLATTELDRLMRDVEARAVVVPTGTATSVDSLIERMGVPRVEHDWAAAAREHVPVPSTRQPRDVALILHTAGTTARPKQVPLTVANLSAAAHNVAVSLALEPVDRCLCAMPLFHSHGLLGASMSSLYAGGSVVVTPPFDPRHFLTWAAARRCSWYTAAPTIHQLVLGAPGEWSGFRFLRSASAPLPPQVALSLEDRFGAPMIEVYGMTEAYQIAANPLPPGERRPGSVGVATGTEIGVLTSSGAVSSSGAGEVVVRGPSVFGGYGGVDAAEQPFVDGWFRTGDLGDLDSRGYLRITGRLKEQINRGGEKIAPREVEEVVLDHPDVLEAMAFPVPDDAMGEEIGVAVVLRTGAELDIAALRHFARDRVAAFKLPKHLIAVDEIPKSSTGKLMRSAFVDRFAVPSVDVRHQSVRGEVSTEGRLATIWRELLELPEDPPPEARFVDLGGTSILVMELVIRIEADFGVVLPLLDVLDVAGVAALADRIDAMTRADLQQHLLRPFRADGTDGTVVLVPGQWGMAVGLDLIAKAVDPRYSVHLFDYPGYRDGDRVCSSIECLASVLDAELRRAELPEPILVYGNSMGAWVALEVARARTGAPSVPLVAIGDMYSPVFNGGRIGGRAPLASRVKAHLRAVRRAWSDRSTTSGDGVSRSVIEQRRAKVQRASDVARVCFGARRCAADLLIVSATERRPRYGPTLGYERHVQGELRCVSVDGIHESMHRTNAAEIGAAITRMLDDHRSRSSRP